MDGDAGWGRGGLAAAEGARQACGHQSGCAETSPLISAIQLGDATRFLSLLDGWFVAIVVPDYEWCEDRVGADCRDDVPVVRGEVGIEDADRPVCVVEEPVDVGHDAVRRVRVRPWRTVVSGTAYVVRASAGIAVPRIYSWR